MSSQQDFDALAKLRSEVAADIEMRRYQLEGIDLSIECLRATAKPLTGAAAAAAGKNSSPKDDRKAASTAKPPAEPAPSPDPAPIVPASPQRARLTE